MNASFSSLYFATIHNTCSRGNFQVRRESNRSLRAFARRNMRQTRGSQGRNARFQGKQRTRVRNMRRTKPNRCLRQSPKDAPSNSTVRAGRHPSVRGCGQQQGGRGIYPRLPCQKGTQSPVQGRVLSPGFEFHVLVKPAIKLRCPTFGIRS